MAVLLIGTGVGAGILADGVTYRGATNSAGEFGHTTIERGGRLCRCGRRGCLEAYVGATGIIGRYEEAAPGSPLVHPGDDIRTITSLVEAANGGDRTAAAVLDETADLLGEGIGNLVNLVNPAVVVLGGWVSVRLGGYVLPRIKQAVEATALSAPLRATRIVLGQLHDDAVAMGAATLALAVFLKDPAKLRSRSEVRPGGAYAARAPLRRD